MQAGSVNNAKQSPGRSMEVKIMKITGLDTQGELKKEEQQHKMRC